MYIIIIQLELKIHYKNFYVETHNGAAYLATVPVLPGMY